jgi:hypothetical protein
MNALQLAVGTLAVSAVLALGPGLSWSTVARPKPARPGLKSPARCRHDRDCTSRFADLDRGRCSEAGHRVERLDLNHDGKPDLWKIYEKVKRGQTTTEVLSCKKLDLNFDGTIDVLKHYDRQGGVEIEESDLDFDGRVDLIVVRGGGANVRHTVGDGSRCVAARCIISP